MSLDPKTNAQSEALANAEKHAPPPLEPDFPYGRVYFDPFFFNVTPLTLQDEHIEHSGIIG